MPTEKTGIGIFICGRGERRNCSSCGRPANKLCDYPVKRRGAAPGTCDRPICGTCAVSVGPNKDNCPPHARLAAKEKPGA